MKMKAARISLWLTDIVLLGLTAWVISWSGAPPPDIQPPAIDPVRPPRLTMMRVDLRNPVTPDRGTRDDALIELLGTNSANDPAWRFAYLRVNGRFVTAFVGDVVEGWRLTAVSVRTATLTDGTRERVVVME